jgi:hypothetical protein
VIEKELNLMEETLERGWVIYIVNRLGYLHSAEVSYLGCITAPSPSYYSLFGDKTRWMLTPLLHIFVWAWSNECHAFEISFEVRHNVDTRVPSYELG